MDRDVIEARASATRDALIADPHAERHFAGPCPACGIAIVPAGELCGPCCVREADLLIRALECPRFARMFDGDLLSLAITELA